MDLDNNIAHALMRMAGISNQGDLTFNEKLQCILTEVVSCINADKGSIMINMGEDTLEVVASTDAKLIGVQQRISGNSPASYVFLTMSPLYMENGVQEGPPLRNQYQNYTKDAFLVVPILSGENAVGVLSVTDKKGTGRFTQQEREIIMTFAGQLIGAIENYRLTEELMEKQRALEEKNKKVEELERLRTDLFNMLIHDLKGPIAEILANIDILSYTVDAENLEYVKAAQTGCDTLYRMTSDLLDIARLEEGSLPLALEQIKPEELVSDAISMVHSIARTRAVGIEEKRPENKEDRQFYGDRAMLLRVLQNFLMNAIQYTPTEETMVVGYDYDTRGDIRFFVADQGPGIAPEFQTAIFDKFFQVEKRNDGRIYSTGLGLAFCKLAVKAHGGHIHVESDGKKGSRFNFVIPLTAAI